MAFTATIVVSGVCGIVPKKNPPTDPEAFCVVLPNAWQADVALPRPGLDGLSILRRHAPFVYFTTQPFDPTNKRQDLEGLWYLQNHRLRLRPVFAGSPPAASWGNIAGGSIAGLAAYDDIADAGNQPLLSVVNATNQAPDPLKIVAQIVIENGELSCPVLNPEWVFDNYLRFGSSSPSVKRLNNRVSVTLPNLLSLDVVLEDFPGTQIKTFNFSNGPAFISAVNLCDDNPLQWGNPPSPRTLPDDEDFRWHYEIVDDPNGLKNALAPFRCPIPRLTSKNLSGNGLDCLPIRYSEVNFNL